MTLRATLQEMIEAGDDRLIGNSLWSLTASEMYEAMQKPWYNGGMESRLSETVFVTDDAIWRLSESGKLFHMFNFIQHGATHV